MQRICMLYKNLHMADIYYSIYRTYSEESEIQLKMG